MAIYYYFAPFLIGLILFLAMKEGMRAPGVALAKKFASIGDLKGKSLSEIVKVVGQYQSRSAGNQPGQEVVQWLQSGYHITLLFQGEVCQGVTHEFLAK